MVVQKQKSKKKRKANSLIQRAAINIKYCRVQKGISQEKLENETGLYISRYESGKHDMTLTTIYILGKHLSVRPCDLLK